MNTVNALTKPNSPSLALQTGARNKPFFDSRELKLVDPNTGRGFALKFGHLASRNGFNRTTETLAVFFQRRSAHEISKLALKQSRDLGLASDAILSGSECRGSILAGGKSIEWDLRLEPRTEASFNAFPRSLRRLGLFRNRSVTIAEDLLASGSVTVDGNKVQLESARATLRTSRGPALLHSWAWGQCNAFVDEKGDGTDFIFEGTTGRARVLGFLPGPRFSTFFFRYKGQSYAFNSAWSSLRLRSRNSLTQWQFRADRGDLSFRGELKAEHRDFAGITREDTDGSLCYSAYSLISDARIHIYRQGKLETTLTSVGGAALEVVGRKKNRYVPLLL